MVSRLSPILIHHEHFKSKILNFLQENRNNLNSLDGYGIIDGDDKAINFIEHGMIPFIAVNKILLLSDGLRLHSHREKRADSNTWLVSAKTAFSSGLDSLEKQLLTIENSDPACIYYPR